MATIPSTDFVNEDPPADFLCPISYEVMTDPVIIETGITYDRRSIEQWWFKRNQRTCPSTQRIVKSLELTPNTVLKAAIDEWLECHPSYEEILETEDSVQSVLFPCVDNKAVSAHAALEKLGRRSTDQEALVALNELKALGGWPELPGVLINTGAYLDVMECVNVGSDAAKTAATKVMKLLCSVEAGQRVLAEVCFLDAAVRNLTAADSSHKLQRACVKVLYKLASNHHNKVKLLYSRVSGALFKLLDCPDTRSKLGAVRLLAVLASVDAHDFQSQMAKANGLEAVLDCLSSDSEQCISAALGIVEMVARSDGGKVEVVEAGGVLLFIRLLRSGQPRVRERVAGLLAALVANTNSKLKLVELVGLEPFAALLLSDSEPCKRLATAMLFQLVLGSADSASLEGEGRALHLSPSRSMEGGRGLDHPSVSNHFLSLGRLLNSGDAAAKQSVQNKVCLTIIEGGGLNMLVALLTNGDEESREKAILLLSHLAAVRKANAAKFVEAGAVQPLVQLLGSHSHNCCEHAAGIVANLAACGGSAVKRQFMDAGAVGALLGMMHDPSLRAVADDALRRLLGFQSYWVLMRRHPPPSAVGRTALTAS